MLKSSGVGKSVRMPLNDISNGRKSSKRKEKKKISDESEENVLDRLLLAHSDLSNLILLIDELIVQALKVKVTSKEGRKEIKSFTNVLNDMHESLKSWFPRFQNSLSTSSLDSENQGAPSIPGKTIPITTDEICNVADSPELESGSQISPSPLVSWCNDHNIENGRQLFLLTPLPASKELPSKNPGLSRLLFERKIEIPSEGNIERPPLSTTSGTTIDDLLERAEVKPFLGLISEISELENTRDSEFTSPPKFSKQERSLYLMTPSLKTSPPKSCVLLEPSFLRECNDKHNSTPFDVGNQSRTSEPLISSLKYPVCFELQKAHKFENGKTETAALPNYSASPPKSYVLIEPSSILVTPEKQLARPTAATAKDVKEAHRSVNQELLDASVSLVESTPMWNVSESKMGTGKLPGETTLKRELWTKFEAASSNVLRFNTSVLLETSRKGFLEKLEEVSCDNDNASSPPDDL